MSMINAKQLFKGRLNRGNFFIGFLINLIAIYVIAFTAPENLSGALGSFYMIIFFLLLVLYISLILRRIHDFGWSAWYFILIGIPFANWYFLFCMFLKQGNNIKNRYGEKPTRNFNFREILAIE